MKTYALIQHDKVANVILWDGDAEQWQPPEDFIARAVEEGETVNIGYGYDQSADEFFPPPTPPVPPPAVPQQVTMRQARLALHEAGKLNAVAEAIASMPSPEKERAEIEWEYASTVERGSSFLQGLAAALGMEGDELDQLFALAATM